MKIITIFITTTLLLIIVACSDNQSITEPKTVASWSLEQIDKSLDTAFRHARSYPPRFDSEQQRNNIEKELKVVIAQLETMLAGSGSNPEILFRLGKANTFAYNLDIEGSGKKAQQHFSQLFSIEKNHTDGHLFYGQHLSGKGEFDQAIEHLKIAAEGGRDIALQMIGITYLQKGDNDQAVVYLKKYQKLYSDAPQVNMLLDSLDPNTESKYKFTPKHN